MAARSTRRKIVDCRERVLNDLEDIQRNLMQMYSLADDRSVIITESLPITIRSTELLKDLLVDLFKGL